MTSHWGMGLLANDGTQGWAPGNAQFNDPRGGDRVIRGMIASGPHGRRSKWFAALAFDSLLQDDIMYEGDTGTQLVGALVYGREQPNTFGAYFVRRNQRATSGRDTEVYVFDATGKATLELTESTKLILEGELAMIFGTTELGPTVDFPEHKVRQLGASARATLDAGDFGGVVDFLFTSGDGDLDDDTQSGFKVDPNYSMGLLLYRQVIAGQTGRAPVNAGNPDIVGLPPDDVDRFATRGTLSGTLAFFPRAYYRPLDGLEVYGGPLFAFASQPLADPFNTRLAGGSPRNALNGAPGGYLGTEIDVGLRFRAILLGSELTAGLEGGVLLPGSAFTTADGGKLDTVMGGRAMLRYQL